VGEHFGFAFGEAAGAALGAAVAADVVAAQAAAGASGEDGEAVGLTDRLGLFEGGDGGGAAGVCGGGEERADLFAGRAVNGTENRPAIHAALRDPGRIEDAGLKAAIIEAKSATAVFARRCANGEALDGFTVERVVNIGIGGSDLGPRFVWDALKAFRRPGVEIRFVSNLDPTDLEDALEGADPETTLVCVTSKSFTTQETLMNALAARACRTRSLSISRP
jgi:glucose-6-phosphate isomerase